MLGAQQRSGGSVGCRGAQWGAGGTRDMQQQGEQGWTDLHYQSIPKMGEGLCVSPTLYPSLTPWPGCSLGLPNPQRPEMGPPRWCKRTGWPLDLCFPPRSPLPHAPRDWSSAMLLPASVSLPSRCGDTSHPIYRQACPHQTSGLPLAGVADGSAVVEEARGGRRSSSVHVPKLLPPRSVGHPWVAW